MIIIAKYRVGAKDNGLSSSLIAVASSFYQNYIFMITAGMLNT
jgi:hypothetical protein